MPVIAKDSIYEEYNWDTSSVNDLDGILPLLEEMYVVRILDDIRWFLEENPSLVFIVFQAHAFINYFFPYSQKRLSVVSDPEISDHFQLLISIAAKLNAEEAFDALRKLDKYWWLSARRQTNGLVNITVEF